MRHPLCGVQGRWYNLSKLRNNPSGARVSVYVVQPPCCHTRYLQWAPAWDLRWADAALRAKLIPKRGRAASETDGGGEEDRRKWNVPREVNQSWDAQGHANTIRRPRWRREPDPTT
eukprot:9097050-Pyramimonas_sp.AAC.1